MNTLLNTGHTERQVAEHVTAGMRSAGGIRSKLGKLADGTETMPNPEAASSGSSLAAPAPGPTPDGCGDCLGGWITDADGRDRKCPACLPTPTRTAVA